MIFDFFNVLFSEVSKFDPKHACLCELTAIFIHLKVAMSS